MHENLGEYATALYQAENIGDAFLTFESTVVNLGFDGALYTYIPKALLISDIDAEPVYYVSQGYCPNYVNDRSDARSHKNNPSVGADASGEAGPIGWRKEICEQYKMEDDVSSEDTEEKVARTYGTQNGVTIRLMSGEQGIALASFIILDESRYSLLMAEKLEALTLRAKMFHSLVMSNACYLSEFTQPLVNSFSQTQLRYLAGLASGKKTSEIARDMGTTPGYLDQSMTRLRRKLSGTDEHETPRINRNQLLYYAGLLNILEQHSE